MLEQMLMQFRTQRAMAFCLPIYCVLGDLAIKNIVKNPPQTLDEMRVFLGKDKCAEMGPEILQLIAASRRAPPEAEPCTILRHNNKSQLKKPKIPGKKRLLQTLCNPGAPPSGAPSSAHLRRGLRNSAMLRFDGDGDESDVYVIELLGGRVYVGKSTRPQQRIWRHQTGNGAAFTKCFPPTGVQLPRLGNVKGRGDAAERDETLRYMLLRGVQNVRGWKYTQLHLSREEEEEAELNIRELYDFCRKCGYPGHFVSQCKAHYDRLGRRV